MGSLCLRRSVIRGSALACASIYSKCRLGLVILGRMEIMAFGANLFIMKLCVVRSHLTWVALQVCCLKQ
jgi:hypothetical protein